MMLEGSSTARRAELIATNDPDECAARMRAIGMNVQHYQMSSGSYSAVIETVLLHPSLRVSRTAYGAAITSRGAPPANMYALALPLSDPAGVFFNHHPLQLHEIGLVRPREEFRLMRTPGFECAMVFPDPAMIDAMCDVMFGRSFAKLIGGGRALSSDRTRIAACAARVAEICSRMNSLSTAKESDGAIQRMGEVLLDELLHIVHGPEPIPGWSSRERIVRKAWEIVDGHEDIVTVSDICLKLSVPIRSLDEAFRACLGMSPKHFMLGARLNKARHCLSRPSDTTTVSDTATRFGFYHFGHFSSQYRRLFGETPSQTLHHSRA
jgi:AraC family ethanolamine operon transcriptional activator